jgi:hypothetical protein
MTACASFSTSTWTPVRSPRDRTAELGRILRYWGGSMKQVPLDPGATQDLYDSGYTAVGSWRIED